MEKEVIEMKLDEELVDAKRFSPITKRFKFTSEQLKNISDLPKKCISEYFNGLIERERKALTPEGRKCLTGSITNFRVEKYMDENFDTIYAVRIEEGDMLEMNIQGKPTEVDIHTKHLSKKEMEEYPTIKKESDQVEWVLKLFDMENTKHFISAEMKVEEVVFPLIQLVVLKGEKLVNS